MSGRDEMRPATPGVKLTYDDFVLFPDDGQRHELIDGVHYVTPSPARKHQAIVWNLTVLIGNYLLEQPVGPRILGTVRCRVFRVRRRGTGPAVHLVRQTDEVLTTKHVRGAPDLVVEIGSPTTRKRDETIKRRLYERFGVSEYWVIDPDDESVYVYRRTGEVYARVAELTLERHDVLTTPLLAGLDLPLERIFRD